MHVLKILPALCFLLFSFTAQSQTNWSLGTSIGIASENNLGDTGLRLSSKVSRYFGKSWNVFAQFGTFQMFESNEKWTASISYQTDRTISTTNLDLGAGIAFLNKNWVRLNFQAAGTLRISNQLWPQSEAIVNGQQAINYTHEKLVEYGYALGLDLNIKASKKVWITLDAHSHNYNFFGEYLGMGLGATINL